MHRKLCINALFSVHLFIYYTSIIPLTAQGREIYQISARLAVVTAPLGSEISWGFVY
jgi:hypothetical protein